MLKSALASTTCLPSQSLVSNDITKYLQTAPNVGVGVARLFHSMTVSERLFCLLDCPYILAYLVVNNLPAMQETQVWSLGWEGPLEMGMAIHSSSCLENPCGQRRLVGYSPWGHKELDMTEPLLLLYISMVSFNIESASFLDVFSTNLKSSCSRWLSGILASQWMTESQSLLIKIHFKLAICHKIRQELFWL